jgi:hypothetical protein
VYIFPFSYTFLLKQLHVTLLFFLVHFRADRSICRYFMPKKQADMCFVCCQIICTGWQLVLIHACRIASLQHCQPSVMYHRKLKFMLWLCEISPWHLCREWLLAVDFLLCMTACYKPVKLLQVINNVAGQGLPYLPCLMNYLKTAHYFNDTTGLFWHSKVPYRTRKF